MYNTQFIPMQQLNEFHITSFSWFTDREKGRPCLIAGMAPNIVNFPFTQFDGVIITVGDGPFRLSKYFTPNYWVSANTTFPIPEIHGDMINSLKKTVFIFADSVAYCYRNFNKSSYSHLQIPWFNYDQRHFSNQKCPEYIVKKNTTRCCRLLELFPKRGTLQEFIQVHFHRTNHYSTASTVAIHAFAFALLMGCNPIFIHGVEIPKYQKDYIYPKNKKADKIKMKPDFSGPLPLRYLKIFKYLVKSSFLMKLFIRKKSFFYKDIPEIISDFSYLADIAHDNGVQVYRLSKTTTLRKVQYIKYREQVR